MVKDEITDEHYMTFKDWIVLIAKGLVVGVLALIILVCIYEVILV